MRSAYEAFERLQEAADDGRLQAACERFEVDLLTVFGSAVSAPAGGTAARDLDVAVLFRRGAHDDVLSLLAALMELADFEPIDLMTLNRAGPVARVRALVRCEVLYEATAGLAVRAQLRAMSEQMDTAHFRKLELELLRR